MRLARLVLPPHGAHATHIASTLQTGQISDLVLMEDFKARFATEVDAMGQPAFNPWLEGLIVSLLSAGTAIGVLLGAPLADFFGRRWAMSIECAVFSVGVLIQVTSFYAWYQIAIGRLITGLGVGALSAAVPLYQSETVPRQIRGGEFLPKSRLLFFFSSRSVIRTQPLTTHRLVPIW